MRKLSMHEAMMGSASLSSCRSCDGLADGAALQEDGRDPACSACSSTSVAACSSISAVLLVAVVAMEAVAVACLACERRRRRSAAGGIVFSEPS